MDSDADGVIKVDHVMRVIELLGKQHVEMAPKQINEIIDMLQKEDMMEVESNLEKVLVKETGESSADKEEMLGEGEDLRDSAKDMTEQEPEEHIKEMFSEKKQQQVGMRASGEEESARPSSSGDKAASKRAGDGASKSDKPPIDLK